MCDRGQREVEREDEGELLGHNQVEYNVVYSCVDGWRRYVCRCVGM